MSRNNHSNKRKRPEAQNKDSKKRSAPQNIHKHQQQIGQKTVDVAILAKTAPMDFNALAEENDKVLRVFCQDNRLLRCIMDSDTIVLDKLCDSVIPKLIITRIQRYKALFNGSGALPESEQALKNNVLDKMIQQVQYHLINADSSKNNAKINKLAMVFAGAVIFPEVVEILLPPQESLDGNLEHDEHMLSSDYNSRRASCNSAMMANFNTIVFLKKQLRKHFTPLFDSTSASIEGTDGLQEFVLNCVESYIELAPPYMPVELGQRLRK